MRTGSNLIRLFSAHPGGKVGVNEQHPFLLGPMAVAYDKMRPVSDFPWLGSEFFQCFDRLAG